MKEFRRLLKYLRPNFAIFVLAIAAMFFGALFETATGALFVPLFNQFLPSGAQNPATLFGLQNLIPENDWYRAWLVISVLLVAFTVLKGIAEYFSSYLMAKIGQAAVLDLRQQLYAHLLDQSADFFQKHRTNYLVSRLVTSCSAIEISVASEFARYSARRFDARLFSRRGVLLQLAFDARRDDYRADYRRF